MAILTTSLDQSDLIDAYINHVSFENVYHHPVYRGLIFTLIKMRWEGNPSTLADAFERRDSDAETYQHCLEGLGYETETVDYRDASASNLTWQGPGLLIASGHSLIVIDITDGIASGYDYINDTQVTLDLRQLNFKLIYPTKFSQLFRESSNQGSGARGWMRTLVAPYVSKFKDILLISFVINLLGALNPFFIMSVYQHALPAASKENLFWIVMGALIVVIGEHYFKRRRSVIFDQSGGEIANRISHEVVTKLLWLPYSRTSVASESAQLARIRDIDNIRRTLVSESTQSWFDLPYVIVFLIAILILAGSTALLVVAGVICMIVFAIISRITSSLAATQSSQASAKLQAQWHELLSSLDSIQGLPLERIVRLRFVTALEKSEVEGAASRLLNMKIMTIGGVLTQVIGASCIIFASSLVMNGDIDFGAMLAIVLLVWKCLSPFVGIYNSINRLKQVAKSSEQVDALMQITDERVDLNKSTPVCFINANVNVSDLTFKVPGSEFILKQLNFKVKSNDWFAISGPSGSGKSSIMSVFLRLIENYQGKVCIDDMSIKQFNAYTYRTLIRSKPQHMDFLELSLRENFQMFAGYYDDNYLRRFLKHMRIEEFFPQGVDTLLSSEFTISLPTDIQEILTIAVTLGSHDGGLVIFDEALSGTDIIYQRRLIRWLKDNYQNTTFMFISNERELISSCKSILLLSDDGSQKYFGSVDKVLENYETLLNTKL
ncbi:ABC transporter transmembrane domain-containing protein [Umboniibacter marinipuniceus]|uniref:ABC-type bacteriocin/lantibiotic exporter with double-glycine peptidase domain n=1 Tax=Umboniibacter marinipuniceus TaxID=569599 RepID=A0A3M0AE38_9GAMM|nr:ABC transporter transmembrane domain-containing protein [Umboniibacter marinipuniceus]RMA82767.1 ABC-type bacteriocin/lantibiotic exporter with double-glycine peptidase domain [Umboniibacter marinipuniceus]